MEAEAKRKIVGDLPYDEVLRQRRAELQIQLEGILASAKQFVWEVGCGHGHFLAAYALAHPDQICIGIDIASDRIDRAHRKRDRANLGNLHFIRSEARFFLENLPANKLISDVFVLFPDPWPKARHHKHRILQPAFLAMLATRVGDGARLYFRTDDRPYFDDAFATVRESPYWSAPSDERWHFEHETVFQSRASSYYSLTSGVKKSGQPPHMGSPANELQADRPLDFRG